MAGIKMRIMVKEVELWKQEMELLSDQSEFSIMSDQWLSWAIKDQ